VIGGVLIYIEFDIIEPTHHIRRFCSPVSVARVRLCVGLELHTDLSIFQLTRKPPRKIAPITLATFFFCDLRVGECGCMVSWINI